MSSKPQKTFPEIEFKEPYTPSYDPPGIVYEDLDKQKRVLRADELYKFSDGTLKSVRDEIHHRVLDFRLDYSKGMPKRKWTAVDRKRLSLMIELIDKQLREREIIRNLERLVGARELEMDYKLIMLTFDQHFCDACKIRKQAHASHKAKNIVSTTRCLELLHMDLFGPFTVKSYGGNRYTLVIVDDYSRKIKESLNVTFDETPLPSKTSPLADDDFDEEEAIKVAKKRILENDIEDETLEIDEIVNIKESRNHPLKNVIGNLNQRTLRPQAQN
ncbi:retrovirus-related pol polyprotein from transposon TNT 1-94 [Tanacetum coccineum]|uniref:Retrovirus-related pol polyprotein from transposon TNT 1-94 n=1 Tax=Tanacetum coccineum TaxID=301880 RepID=A0ABQ5J7R3_9ASTR